MTFKINYKFSSTIPNFLHKNVYIIVWRQITCLLLDFKILAAVMGYEAPGRQTLF